jgi:hypothetical protein
MELVQSFAAAASNPFSGPEDAASATAAAAAPPPNWDALPHDVRGLVLDYVAAGSVMDFVSLSSCSRAWRYASQAKAQTAAEVGRLRAAHLAERSFGRGDRRRRRQVLRRAVRRKVRADACYVVALALMAAFGLACLAGAAAGMHVLFAAGSPDPAPPLLPNCTNGTAAAASQGNATCCAEGETEPLRGSAFAVAFFWMAYGAGFAVLASCGLFVELNIRHRGAYDSPLDVLALTSGCLLLVVGVLGLFAIAPAWFFLGQVPVECVDPGYRSSFSGFVIGATGACPNRLCLVSHSLCQSSSR